tara:strand:- start:5119 stop:5256 length:138 start_codon:yes stop_codon:yes gene_type:complete
MEEIKWSYEDLKKALLDSASDYDRIVQNMRTDDTKDREKKSTSEE